MKELSQTLLNDVNFFSQENEHVGSWLSYDWKSNDLQCHEYWAIGTILQSLIKACCKFMKISSYVWILQASISPTNQVEWTFALFQTFDMLIIDSYDCWIDYTSIMILTVITPAHKSSADELKASARCLQNAEKKKHWRWKLILWRQLCFWSAVHLNLPWNLCYWSAIYLNLPWNVVLFCPQSSNSLWKAKQWTLVAYDLQNYRCHVNQMFVIIAQ